MHLIAYVGVALIAIAARVLLVAYQAITSSNRRVPGPFWARFTRLWYFSSVWNGHAEQDHIALHRKYAKPGQYFAPVVRLGPNLFSIIEPDKQVYGVSSQMKKSTWYEGWKHPSPDRWTLFPDQNIQRHNETRKKFQGIYSLSSLISYEKYVDDCADIFQERLGEMAGAGDWVNMGHWLQCYAFDVIGNITYSQRFGFLDAGQDQGGIMQALENSMPYSTLVGIYAWLHPYLFAIMQRLPGSGAAGRAHVMKYTNEQKAKREAQRQAWDTEGKGVEAKSADTPEDFLDKIMDMKAAGKGVTDYHVFMMGLSNIIAGSDTTAISLSSILYHLIRTPAAMQKLRQEIQQKTDRGECEPHRVSFRDSQEMPYLQACIKEGLRLHSATGLPLWRVVNEDNTQICGERFSRGDEVGINAWVAHYNADIWGADVEEFRPERWLEAEKDPERLKQLEQYYMPFGLGSRTCLGKHISYLEMTKLIPQVVRNFDFELLQPNKPWECKSYWFVKPRSFLVRVSRIEK